MTVLTSGVSSGKVGADRILIIHRYFWPENIAVLPLMLRDIVHLHLEMGHTVEVVCGCSSDFREDWNAEFNGRVKFSWFHAGIDRDLSKFGRIINLTKLASKGLRAIFSNGKKDIVYLVSYPPLHAGLMLCFSKIFCRSKHHIYYLQDNHSYMIGSDYLRNIYKKYLNYLVLKCSRVITLSAPMKAELLSGFRGEIKDLASSRIVVIENYSTDLDHLQFSSSYSKEINSVDIVYAGNHGIAQNLHFFFDVLALMESSNRPSVDFYGNGTEKASLMAKAKMLGLPIRFYDAVGRAEISRIISSAKLGLVAAQPGLMGYAFPSKLAAYNSAGTKSLVMCESQSEMCEWLLDNEIGYSIDPENLEKAVSQLVDLLGSDMINYSGSDVIKRSRQIYSRESYIAKIAACINKLSSK